MGKIAEQSAEYRLKSKVVKSLLNKKMSLEEVKETDFKLEMTQKGVDMTIGIDIAILSLKKQVDRIILIAADSDFVPAAKLARREGIDFVLDPMWLKIRPDLFEHIDGLITKAKFNKNNNES